MGLLEILGLLNVCNVAESCTLHPLVSPLLIRQRYCNLGRISFVPGTETRREMQETAFSAAKALSGAVTVSFGAGIFILYTVCSRSGHIPSDASISDTRCGRLGGYHFKKKVNEGVGSDA